MSKLELATPRDVAPDSIADLADLALVVRSLQRQVESLRRRLDDRVQVEQPLPLRQVAPLVGYSVSRLGTLLCDPQQRKALDLDVLFYKIGRRWFSNAKRVQQWLDLRARKDPRLPAGTTLSELVDRQRSGR